MAQVPDREVQHDSPLDAEVPFHDMLSGVGHIGPYYPYDYEDIRAPRKEKDPPGFVRDCDYVRGGVVRKYKSKRKR